VHLAGHHHVSVQSLDQGAYQRTASADTASHGRAVQLHALPGIDSGLAVQWLMISVFGNQYVSVQPRRGNAALNRPAWRLSLDDAITTGAGLLAPHLPNHPE
jgi:hypothetical protein